MASVLPVTSLDGLAWLLGVIGLVSVVATLTASVHERAKVRAEQRATAMGQALHERMRDRDWERVQRERIRARGSPTVKRHGLGPGSRPADTTEENP